MCKLKGIRTDCMTAEKYQVELEWAILETERGKVFQLIGGPTGYESFYINQKTIQRMKRNGWTACMGDVGYKVARYDRLEISAEEMVKVFEALENEQKR